MPECQKLKCRLDLDGTEQFPTCNYLTPLHFRGLRGKSEVTWGVLPVERRVLVEHKYD